MRTPVPLRPDYSGALATERTSRALSITRGIHTLGRRALFGGKQADEDLSDPVTRSIVEKGVVTPADTGTVTALRQTTIDTLQAVMGPKSAIGQLLPKMLNVGLEGLYGVTLPSIATDADAVGWVSEGNPIPVKQFAFDAGITLTTKKMATIVVASRELFEYSSCEPVLRDLMARNSSLGFEKALFGTDAASASQPAGLRYGINATAATAGGTDEAMITDLSNIGASVAAVSSDLFYVAGPAAGIKIGLRQPLFKYPLAISSALADDQVLCLSPSCVAIAGGLDAPKLDVSIETSLHMADDPAPLTTATTAAFPIQSLYQSDCVSIRLRADVDFALRSSAALAWVDGISW
ncbi:phage major capsid protein [Bradyrhizobium sp. CCBAU 11434]|uniref:phage major capsid protein n=1 Tax=Bradyrhizobium sp. CCBAU 11434 TaxID=1630885 RepID=UPI002306A823|nr:phage major capsid protein [Bradyrhizobium sp. CCBAU 11434]